MSEKLMPVPCCPKMAEFNIDNLGPQEGFEAAEDGTFNLNGCCRGGCYVMSGITHCLFCGAKL